MTATMRPAMVLLAVGAGWLLAGLVIAWLNWRTRLLARALARQVELLELCNPHLLPPDLQAALAADPDATLQVVVHGGDQSAQDAHAADILIDATRTRSAP